MFTPPLFSLSSADESGNRNIFSFRSVISPQSFTVSQASCSIKKRSLAYPPECDIMGIDLNALTQEVDFQTSMERQLQGKDLIKYLIASNEILKEKVHTYCKKYEEAQDRWYPHSLSGHAVPKQIIFGYNG